MLKGIGTLLLLIGTIIITGSLSTLLPGQIGASHIIMMATGAIVGGLGLYLLILAYKKGN